MIQFFSKRFNISPKTERMIFNAGLLVTLISIVFIAVILAWLWQPSKVITIYNEPIPTLKEAANVGDTIVFKIKYCKANGSTGNVNWYIVGNRTVTLLPSYTDVTPKSCNTVLDPVALPPQLKPGVYYIVWQVTYPVNPLKIDYTEFRSRDFTIK